MQDRTQPQAQPRRISVFDKWKIWIWNSSKTFEYIPKTLFSEAMGLAFLGASLAIAGAFIGGFLAFGFLGLFIPKVSALTVGVNCATALGIIVAAATVPAILITRLVGELAIKATAGLTGTLVGLATSFLVFCKNPHRIWSRRFNQERNAVIQQQIELARMTQELPQGAVAHRGLSRITSNPLYRFMLRSYGVATQPVENFVVNRSKIPPKFIKFASFNPNVTKCALTGADLGIIPTDSKSAELKPSHPPVKEVVLASDGQFYLLEALKDPANADKITGLTWTDADKVPEYLRPKFIEKVTTCAILSDTLEQKDAVRSIYGHYYSRQVLQDWVERNPTCPMSRHFLSMNFTSPIDEELEIGPRSAKVAPAPNLTNALVNYDDTTRPDISETETRRSSQRMSR